MLSGIILRYLLRLLITSLHLSHPMKLHHYVAMLLKEHHEHFTELYPNSPIIPKMQYMIHLPEWMRRHVS